MNIIFLTISNRVDVNNPSIYSDLMIKFRNEGHEVYIVYPREKRTGERTQRFYSDDIHYLGVKTLNLRETNIIEKGVGQILIESQFENAIKKYLVNVKFDLILYSTPPITFSNVIKYLKSYNPHAKSYLLLKDIFPQNAVDIGLMKKTGIRGMLYKYFRKKEMSLYALSDFIGCMSPANVEYVLKHHPEIATNRVEVAPNSVELNESANSMGYAGRLEIREKYGLPVDKPIFIYGGNLGKPQGIPYLIQCLDANANRGDCHFVVVGNGTERAKLESWYKLRKPQSVTLLKKLPKDDYDRLACSCDVGLIFLDHRFTIPNFPARVLSYLENKLPILCATDPNCDMGSIAQENGFGYWCESNSVEAFTSILDKMLDSDRKTMGEKGYDFLKKNYLVENTYNAIMSHYQKQE